MRGRGASQVLLLQKNRSGDAEKVLTILGGGGGGGHRKFLFKTSQPYNWWVCLLDLSLAILDGRLTVKQLKISRRHMGSIFKADLRPRDQGDLLN